MIDLNHLTHPFSPFRWVELLLRIFGAKQELRGMFRVASEPRQRVARNCVGDWDRSSILDIRLNDLIGIYSDFMGFIVI